jgi:excisionase family DNA binding protein
VETNGASKARSRAQPFLTVLSGGPSLLAGAETLLTYDEAADLLRCSRRSIERKVASGELGSVRNGRRVLVPLAALRAFVASNTYRQGTGGSARVRREHEHGTRLWGR